ncbi:hypothetical protein D915_000230 [Fasciola hepatica]|uniref:CUB domain-containing protein n=1 Tax=Fasciola hepatica TaxID=6192 RepID=A0A4E0RPI2_FASHE|nr:hypothetical protein D915_000230 [Fasciola hepatica]
MVHCLLISVLMLALITKQNMCSTRTTKHDPSKIPIVKSVFRDRILSSHKPSIGMAPFYKKVDLSRSRKSPSSRPPTKEECISDQFNYAILRGCLCYLFQSTGLSNGSFVSPQLEFINAEQTTCLLFTFVGDQNEIVRLEFTHFLLDPKEPPQEYPTNCRNYVRVFDSLERAELNQNDQEFVRLCGSERNLPQRVYYSAGRVIILEIHLQFHYSNPIDIRGRFEFESKETYQSGGVLVAQSICDRLFLSPDAHLSHFTEKENSLPGINIHSRRGRFFSPGFPRNYPVNNTCTYYFIGTTQERVSIALTDVNLRGTEECAKTDRSDRIEIRDSDQSITFTQTNMFDQHTRDRINAIKPFAVVCGRVSQTQVVSDGPILTIRFVAIDPDKRHGAVGFRGYFQFIGVQDSHVFSSQNRLITRQFESKDHFAEQAVQTYGDNKQLKVKHIKADARQLSGILESPNYPRPYPENLQMLYIFHIPKKMQLRIKFFDFNLDSPNTRNCSLSSTDRLEVYDGAYSETTRPIALCGTELPDALFHKRSTAGELVSSHDLFTLRFVTDALRLGTERGFVLSYAFTSVGSDYAADFPGLKYQDPNSTRFGADELEPSETEGDCQYTISSHGNEDIGHIRIGRHVRSFKYNKTQSVVETVPRCLWRLRGRPGQRIQLKLIKINQVPMPLKPPVRISSIQYDEQPSRDKSEGSTQSKFPHGRSVTSYLDNLKCHTPVSVELVNYRPITAQGEQEFKEMDDLLHEKQYGSRTQLSHYQMNVDRFGQGSHGQFGTTVTDFALSNLLPRLEPLDPVRLCADESVNQSPAAQGFMSGKVPQLDVVLRMDTPVFNEQSESRVWSRLSDYLNLGYDIQYKFVTDYGVIAPFGYQKKPGCFFEFNRSQSLRGNFSSPNYPGLYPTDLVCEYRFSGNHVRKIVITFFTFDVESASKSCTDDRLGDYVELRSCYPMELISYPKRRLCHKQSDYNRYRIEWFEPCLILRFFSNEMFVRTGFLGEYIFHTSGNRDALFYSIWNWALLLIVLNSSELIQ